MVCGNFILPEPASYVFFYAFSNLRNLLYIIARCKGGRPAGGGWMWADVQKGCGMGLGGYADLRVPSFVHTTLHTMHTILHTIFGHSVQLKSWFIRGFRGTAHYAHHFISLIYENI